MAETRKFKKNEVIFREGEEGNTMYDIIYGVVGIYANYGTKSEKLLTKLESEAFFGEMGMIEGLPRSATAFALENTETAVITNENFIEYLSVKPAKAFDVLKHTSYRLRQLSADYIEACAAIYEYVNDEKEGKEHSDELIGKMKKINAARRKK